MGYFYLAYVGAHYAPTTGECYCRPAIAAQSSLPLVGDRYTTVLLGTCVGFATLSSTYTTVPSVPCQNVFYSSSGCLGIDGSPCSLSSVYVFSLTLPFLLPPFNVSQGL